MINLVHNINIHLYVVVKKLKRLESSLSESGEYMCTCEKLNLSTCKESTPKVLSTILSVDVFSPIADDLYSVFHLVETTPTQSITQTEVLVS